MPKNRLYAQVKGVKMGIRDRKRRVTAQKQTVYVGERCENGH